MIPATSAPRATTTMPMGLAAIAASSSAHPSANERTPAASWTKAMPACMAAQAFCAAAATTTAPFSVTKAAAIPPMTLTSAPKSPELSRTKLASPVIPPASGVRASAALFSPVVSGPLTAL
jgi:hypothetical protein